jgi:hypothetical protein
MTNSKIKIELVFTRSEVDLLCHTSCKNFAPKQPNRFIILYESISNLDNDTDLLDDSNATLYFTDDFISSKIIQSFFEASGKASLILMDEATHDFCVISK